jgi:hypothetical protein
MEAGLDSISSVELRNSVSSKFGLELPATVTFDYPSIEALAEFVAASVALRQQRASDVAASGEVGHILPAHTHTHTHTDSSAVLWRVTRHRVLDLPKKKN